MALPPATTRGYDQPGFQEMRHDAQKHSGHKDMKQKATWNDIDRCLSNGDLEEQDYDTLLAFSRVSPPPSNNPAFHVKFQSTQSRIMERIRQLDSEKKAKAITKKYWHDTVPGKISIGVVTGVIVFIITHYLNLKK